MSDVTTVINGSNFASVISIQGPAGPPMLPMRLATTEALPTYSATGTGLVMQANGLLTIDGEAVVVGTDVLVKDEGGGTSVYNRIYTVELAGTDDAPAVLRYKLNVTYKCGLPVAIGKGTENGGRFFIVSTDGPISAGTSQLSWQRVASVDSNALEAVSCDNTLTGDGTSGDPLAVSGDIVDGAAAGATALQAVVTDSTLTGSGTLADPLVVVGGGGGAAVVATSLLGAAFGTSASGTLTFGSNNHLVIDTTGLSGTAAVQLPSISGLSNGETRRVTSYIASGKRYGGTVISTYDSNDSIDFAGNYQDVLTASQSIEYSVHKASSTWRRQRRTNTVLDVRDFGALGIGTSHDDWPAFEAAFAFARAHSLGGGGVGGMISLYVPKPPLYYWCTQRLRPGVRIHMYGDGHQGGPGYATVNQDAGSTIRFPAGCPGFFIDSYPTSQSPYAPPNLSQSDNNTIEKINFYGSGTAGVPTLGSNTPRWASNQNYLVNKYLKPSNTADLQTPPYTGNDYSYVARVVVAGNSGTVEPTWPAMDDVIGYVDGKKLYDSGVLSPPAGAVPSGGNGTCVYELQLAAGIRCQSTTLLLREVSVLGFCGSGILIFGSSGLSSSDAGGLVEDWCLERVVSFNHDRHAIQISWTRFIGNGDTGGGSAKDTAVGACGRESLVDTGDVGNKWDNIHSEFANISYATKVLNSLFTPTLVLGGYSEHVVPPLYGPLTNVIGCYDSFTTTGNTSVDGTSQGFIMSHHRCNYLTGWKGINARLGVGLTLGTYGSIYGPSDQPGYNAAFTINVQHLGHDGFDVANAVSGENYYFEYFNTANGTPVKGCFYLHVGPDTQPNQNFNLGWGITTMDSAHGPGHYLLGTGGYFGTSTPTYPSAGYWFVPSRSCVRYIAYDNVGYALSIADAGARSVGDRVDTPAASVNHLSLQVTRAGLVATVWQASRQYISTNSAPNPPIVRPRAYDTTQAWMLDTTFPGWTGVGSTGSTEPTWPSSPSVNDTVDDPGGAIRWKYVGVCARYQPFGSAEGLISFSVAGSSNVTLAETDEHFLAKCMILTGALTGNINLVLPTLTPSNSNNTLFPTEPFTRWIYNNTSGAHTLTVKTASGTGPTIAQGQAAWVLFDGTNILRMSADVTP